MHKGKLFALSAMMVTNAACGGEQEGLRDRESASSAENITSSPTQGGRQVASDAPETNPSVVRVRVESALINATKVGGACWDVGCGDEAGKTFDFLASLVATADPVDALYAKAAAELAKLAISTSSKPDMWGQAILSTSNGSLAITLPKVNVSADTYTPQWPSIVFEHVPLARGTQFTLELQDDDDGWSPDDAMGTVTFGYEDLRAAEKAGGTYRLNTSTVTHGQVLFVNISVAPEE